MAPPGPLGGLVDDRFGQLQRRVEVTDADEIVGVRRSRSRDVAPAQRLFLDREEIEQQSGGPGAKRAVADGREPAGDALRRIVAHAFDVDGGARREIARLGGIGSLRGLHNAQNAACAVGRALAMGISIDTLQNGLRSFPGLAHRMEQVGRSGNVLFVNDSKATNADAARMRWRLSRYLLDRRGKPKTGGSRASPNIFRASAKPI